MRKPQSMPGRQGIQQCSTITVTTNVTNYAAQEDFSSGSTGGFVAGAGSRSVSNPSGNVLRIDAMWSTRPLATRTVAVTASTNYTLNMDIVGFSDDPNYVEKVRVRIIRPGGTTIVNDYTATGNININFSSVNAGNITIEISQVITGSGSYTGNPYVDIDNFTVTYITTTTTYPTVCSVFDKGYRYGFNGKELDNELGFQDYGFRIYNPSLGKFLSIDPLFAKYSWNSTYAYAENRVIDGIDLEGLEYATIVYKYYYGQTTPVYEVVWHNDLQHNTFGKLGPGVAFRTQTYDKNGVMVSVSATTMYYRLVDHGFYYGPTQLKNVWMVSHYIIEAVDAVDEAGRIHDMAYDAVGATADNATNSWGTIEADEALIESCTKISKLGVGAIDPFNKQKINKDEILAAKVAKRYFELTQWNKIEGVSDWMEQNYSSISKKGSSDKWWGNDNETNQRYNYNLFRDMYMHKNDKGVWVENTGMWKTVGEGKDAYRAPKTPEELKQNNE